MTKKNYLFDFDGTLVNSMPYYARAMLSVLDDEGIKYGEDMIKIITPLGYLGTAKYYKSLGVTLSVEELLGLFEERLYKEYSENILDKECVRETLIKLKAEGASLNVLTASPHIMLDCCLKRLELYDLFDNVWSCDDFKTSKADPKIYKMAAERMGCDVSMVIFVDDNVNAVRTSIAAGCIGVGIFDESSREYKEEFMKSADAYIEDMSQLLNIKI